jgi:hypothetical protein
MSGRATIPEATKCCFLFVLLFTGIHAVIAETVLKNVRIIDGTGAVPIEDGTIVNCMPGLIIFKFGAAPESFQLYRGLTVPVDGGTRRAGTARGSLQLEAKATVKLGSFRGRASLDL